MPLQKSHVMLTGPGFTSSHIAQLQTSRLTPIIGKGCPNQVLPLDDIVGYVLGGDERITARDLEAMPRLRVISFVGSGIEQFVDCAAAKERGIVLTRTPGPMVAAVAEHTIGLLIGLQRGLFRYNRSSKDGNAMPSATLSISDARVGLVGLGSIGLKVAQQLHTAFDCKMLYWSRTRKLEAEAQFGLEYCSFNEILARVDSALILMASNPKTRGVINQELLSAIENPIMMVNTAAAELVDPVALRRALDEGKVSAAAFDGYWREPLPVPSEDSYGLLSYPDSKFVVTPHVAAKSTRAWPRMLEMAVDNLTDYFGGRHATV